MNPLNNRHLVLHVFLRGLLVVALLLISTWLIWPKNATQDSFELDDVLIADVAEDSTDSTPLENRTISTADFDIDLWYVPPVKQPIIEQPPPTPTKLSLQLMAISSGSNQSVRSAVIYDPEQDTIHRVGIGSVIARFRVERITDKEVELHQGQRVAILKLELMEPIP